jgi:hypothetical protein
MAWGTVSHTGTCPWGEVDSWTGEVNECPGVSGGGVYVTSGTSNMTEASVGGRVSSV